MNGNKIKETNEHCGSFSYNFLRKWNEYWLLKRNE